MKHIYKLLPVLITFLVIQSCADDDKLLFDVKKPESITKMEYLQDYEALKSYISSTAGEKFKLGAGVSVGDYNKKSLVYSVINSNFNEMTAGYQMKHGAIVQKDGSMSFGNVESFVGNAKEAETTIYGHTLCWHANQNAEYLNSTIAPIVIPGTGGPAWEEVTSADFETDDTSNYQYNSNAVVSFTANGEGANGEGRALMITNTEVRTNDWDVQFFVDFPVQTEIGQKFRLTMDVKSDADASFPTQAHVVAYEYKHWNFFGTINATSDWGTISVETIIDENTAGCASLAFNLGAIATNYYFDNIKIEWENPDGASGPIWQAVGDINFETDNTAGYQGNENAVFGFTLDGEGANNTGRALTVTNSEVRANDWESQMLVTFSKVTEVGQQFRLSMDIKADVDASIATQAQTAPFAYKHWNFFGTINATSAWQKYETEITIDENTSGCNTIAFNLGNTATTYYFDNILVEWLNPDGGGQTIEWTAEQKDSILTGELTRWIVGMKEATGDYVKAWDVVNEPMDDGNPYELKTGVGRTDLAPDIFYWQDYLGKDYAVKAFNLARENYPDAILFINDYNLEYNIDKCKGIIQYVDYIESKGAEVNGIGTQMHIHTGSDKDKIVEMLTLLAATGKYIKISELDIGIEGGVKTADATEENYIAQAEMYEYVVKKYLEIIPASQQYGITVWSPTDSPESSSWREGEPIGLWTESYDRKPAFSSFADALSGNGN